MNLAAVARLNRQPHFRAHSCFRQRQVHRGPPPWPSGIGIASHSRVDRSAAAAPRLRPPVPRRAAPAHPRQPPVWRPAHTGNPALPAAMVSASECWPVSAHASAPATAAATATTTRQPLPQFKKCAATAPAASASSTQSLLAANRWRIGHLRKTLPEKCVQWPRRASQALCCVSSPIGPHRIFALAAMGRQNHPHVFPREPKRCCSRLSSDASSGVRRIAEASSGVSS